MANKLQAIIQAGPFDESRAAKISPIFNLSWSSC
jgi:hypothetical protein